MISEKYGKITLLLLLLIIIIPKISQIFTGSTLKVFGLSLNDSVLLLIAIAVIIFIALIFLFPKVDFSPSNKRFKKLYRPKSDLDRIRGYVRERLDAGDSKQKILYALRKVGWDEHIIQTAFETANQAKVIKISPKKHIKKSKAKVRK